MHCAFAAATIVVAVIGCPLDAIGAQEVAATQAPTVAVLDFTNSSLVDHATYEPFAVGIAGLLASDLARNANITVVERERLREVVTEIDLGASGQVDESTAARAGRILGARYIVFGVFVIDPRGTLRIDARAVSVETSRVEHVETVTDKADNLLRAVGRLGQQLSEGLDLPTSESAGSEAEMPEAPTGQIQVDLKYARALMEEDRGNVERAIELYQEFLAELPSGYAPGLRRTVELRIEFLQMEVSTEVHL